MAVTAKSFREEFPEYRNADPGLIDAKLADARGLLSAEAWGAKYDQAVKYQAAHLLALSPTGQFARLDRPDRESNAETTIYERRLSELKRALAGPMVI
jgi:hypothetical protein